MSWPNLLEVLKSGVKPLPIGLRSDAYLFSNTAIHRMPNAPNILCPRCKELFKFKCKLVSHFNKLKDTATELISKGTF